MRNSVLLPPAPMPRFLDHVVAGTIGSAGSAGRAGKIRRTRHTSYPDNRIQNEVDQENWNQFPEPQSIDAQRRNILEKFQLGASWNMADSLLVNGHLCELSSDMLARRLHGNPLSVTGTLGAHAAGPCELKIIPT